jgi:hypothetical protein
MPSASAAIDDLFGHVPQERARQSDIEDVTAAGHARFDSERHFLVPTPRAPEGGHTAESIRTQVMKIMGHLRGAETMPFAADELRNHNVWMPYLCEWLKNGEGDALLAEYRTHIERLGGPVGR